MKQPAGRAQLMARYGRREVQYVLGELDTGSWKLDTRCGAMLQGESRLARGVSYYDYLQHVYGPAILDVQRLRIVASAGHSARQIFTSDAGRAALFGREPRPSAR